MNFHDDNQGRKRANRKRERQRWASASEAMAATAVGLAVMAFLVAMFGGEGGTAVIVFCLLIMLSSLAGSLAVIAYGMTIGE